MVQTRNPITVLVLSFITCGIYWFYWLYSTSKELADTTRRTDINAGLDLVLTVVTCGLYGFYAQYRNAKVVFEELGKRGVAVEDRSVLVLALGFGSIVVGVSWLGAVYLLQDDLNKLAAAPRI